jgi:hypothetical protein
MFKRMPIIAGLVAVVVLAVGATSAFGATKPPTTAQRAGRT